MKIFNTIGEWKAELHLQKRSHISLGFVPTMGALHEGHRSLIERSLRENDKTLVSIFLNPTQFENPEDLKTYPQSYEKDKGLLEKWGADYLFYPTGENLYPDGYRYSCRENHLSRILCGASRTGHFDGVLTVVMKLLNIAEADRAYFGEKDYQQYLLIKEMGEAFFVNTEILPCPLVREKDGLALSSRNRRLSQEARKKAPDFYRILSSRDRGETIRKRLKEAGFQVDYVEEFAGRRFGAVFLEEVRLIDNVPVK
ncbi:MAG: pantoate--beta-alanine ligase [Spirochaetales bacterium]|nr:pantoate--beta-alanine ligase [Spirochaetales bacterium]